MGMSKNSAKSVIFWIFDAIWSAFASGRIYMAGHVSKPNSARMFSRLRRLSRESSNSSRPSSTLKAQKLTSRSLQIPASRHRMEPEARFLALR